MKMSADVGQQILKAFESCLKPVPERPGYFRAYKCPANVWTIGWGTTSADGTPITAGIEWPQWKCDQTLAASLPKYERHVDRQLSGGQPVTQQQYDALVDWAYNTGGPASSAVWTYVRKGDVDGVCERLMRWTRGGGRELPGLVRRRRSDCALYRGQINEALRIAGTHRAFGDGMTRQADKPTPPIAEVIKRAPAATGTIAAGTGTAAGSPQASADYSATIMVAGILAAAIGVAFLVTAYRRVSADWS